MKQLSKVFSQDLANRLFEVGRINTFEADAPIFSEGETAVFLPIVVSGKIKVYRFLSPGNEVIVNVFGTGEIFAIPPVLDGSIYPANAAALERSEILLIPRRGFLALLKESNEFSVSIMSRMSELLRETTQSIEILATSSPEERIARILVWLARKEQQDLPLTISLRRQDIAQIAGLATETTIRVIRKFADEGRIKIVRGKIIIEETASLQEAYQRQV